MVFPLNADFSPPTMTIHFVMVSFIIIIIIIVILININCVASFPISYFSLFRFVRTHLSCHESCLELWKSFDIEIKAAPGSFHGSECFACLSFITSYTLCTVHIGYYVFLSIFNLKTKIYRLVSCVFNVNRSSPSVLE